MDKRGKSVHVNTCSIHYGANSCVCACVRVCVLVCVAPPMVVGAWSMAGALRQLFEYYYYWYGNKRKWPGCSPKWVENIPLLIQLALPHQTKKKLKVSQESLMRMKFCMQTLQNQLNRAKSSANSLTDMDGHNQDAVRSTKRSQKI